MSKVDQPHRPSPKSLSPTRQILGPVTKPTHFTMSEIRRLVRQVNKELREKPEPR